MCSSPYVWGKKQWWRYAKKEQLENKSPGDWKVGVGQQHEEASIQKEEQDYDCRKTLKIKWKEGEWRFSKSRRWDYGQKVMVGLETSALGNVLEYEQVSGGDLTEEWGSGKWVWVVSPYYHSSGAGKQVQKLMSTASKYKPSNLPFAPISKASKATV